MPTLDDELSRRVKGASEPVPQADFEGLVRRKEKRELRSRVQTVVSVVALLVVIGGAIFALGRNGNTPVATTPQRSSAQPAVTNGELVSVERGPNGHTWIQASSLDGSFGLKITKGPFDISPSVDPSGKLVAFSRASTNSSYRDSLCIVPIGGGEVRCPLGPSWDAYNPAWSPDGSKIAFAGGGPSRALGIYVAAAGGGRPRLIYAAKTDVTDLGHPSWSPDGSKIVFQMANGALATPPDYDLYVIDVRGTGNAIDLTPHTPHTVETDPAWSPDGTEIALGRQTSAGDVGNSGCHPCTASTIDVVAPDGSGLRALTRGPFDTEPAWSPDGSLIAFSGVGKGPNPYLMTIQTATSPSTPTKVGEGTDVSWQPIPPHWTQEQVGNQGFATISGVPDTVCNVSALTSNFGNHDVQSVAYMFSRSTKGTGCPETSGKWYIALIRNGLGTYRDTYVYGPIHCPGECRLFSAPDLNGDGRAELAVASMLGSNRESVEVSLYEITPGGNAPVFTPVLSSSGEPFTFRWITGSSTRLEWMSCDIGVGLRLWSYPMSVASRLGTVRDGSLVGNRLVLGPAKTVGYKPPPPSPSTFCGARINP
jgi:hypothetical protein